MTTGHGDVSRHVPMYIGVFVALAVLTVLTVFASRMHASTTTHVVVALAIATVKGSLVAAIFMHLRWEKAAVLWGVLFLCATFFVFLMLLPSLSVGDLPPQARMGTWG